MRECACVLIHLCMCARTRTPLSFTLRPHHYCGSPWLNLDFSLANSACLPGFISNFTGTASLARTVRNYPTSALSSSPMVGLTESWLLRISTCCLSCLLLGCLVFYWQILEEEEKKKKARGGGGRRGGGGKCQHAAHLCDKDQIVWRLSSQAECGFTSKSDLAPRETFAISLPPRLSKYLEAVRGVVCELSRSTGDNPLRLWTWGSGIAILTLPWPVECEYYISIIDQCIQSFTTIKQTEISAHFEFLLKASFLRISAPSWVS